MNQAVHGTAWGRGVVPNALRGWVIQACIDTGESPGTTTGMRRGSRRWKRRLTSFRGPTRSCWRRIKVRLPGSLSPHAAGGSRPSTA
jgi:hypothetical protein